jgi:hypothetical protein
MLENERRIRMKSWWILPVLFSSGLAISSLTLAACGNSKPANAPAPEGEASAEEAEGASPASGSSGASASQQQSGLPNNVGSLTSTPAGLDGVKWGMNHNDVTRVFNAPSGMFDHDYDAQLRKLQPGTQMNAVESERESLKKAFERSLIEFKDVPTGLDSTGLRAEYSYKNREAILTVERPGKRRIFFFIGDRLWKIYDEVRLSEKGEFGASYKDAVTKMNTHLGAPGKALAGDAAKAAPFATTEWAGDATTHYRLVDRSSEKIAGVVQEEKGTLGNLAQLRSAKSDDPFALDPSIATVTKGGISDPNARTTPSATATGKTPPPKKK